MRYSNYDAFAYIYNRHWNKTVPPQIWTVIERVLLPCLPRGGQVLDLCCGTGYNATWLAQRGFKVTGLDNSKEMLRFARRNAPRAEFVLADARRFELPSVFHAVVSTFDSLNHIMSVEELATVFRNTHNALVGRGYFLFDMNMERSFRHHWTDYFAIIEEKEVCVLKGAYNEKQRTGHYDIAIFRRKGGAWQRNDAVITERCYTAKEIRDALKKSGFKEIESYDAEKDLGLSEHTGRRFFLARKGF